MRTHPRLLRWLLVGAVVVALPACQLRADVLVRVDEDGSGTVEVAVELDRDAAQLLGDPGLAVPRADLTAAGWSVDDPAASVDGGVVLRATREFTGPEQLAGVLDEVGGRDGVFRNVTLTVTDGFGEVSHAFSADVVLTGSPEQFGDAFLTASLGGLPLGRTPEELAAAGGDDPDVMTLRLRVALPGGVPETDGQLLEGAATWTFSVTGGVPTDATVSTSSTTPSARLRFLVGLGVVALVGSIVLALVGLARRQD